MKCNANSAVIWLWATLTLPPGCTGKSLNVISRAAFAANHHSLSPGAAADEQLLSAQPGRSGMQPSRRLLHVQEANRTEPARLQLEHSEHMELHPLVPEQPLSSFFAHKVTSRIHSEMELHPLVPEQPLSSFFAHKVTSRIHSDAIDWVYAPHEYISLLIPLGALLLSMLIHKRSVARTRMDEQVSQKDKVDGREASLFPLSLLLLTAVLTTGVGNEWLAAQVPLFFMLMGYGVWGMRHPFRLIVPLLVCYVLVLGAHLLQQGLGTREVALEVIERLVPLETISSRRLSAVEGVGLAGCNYGGALACILLTPGLKSICNGTSWQGFCLVWFIAILSAAADFQLPILQVFSGSAWITVPGRIQLPSYCAGLIAASMPFPARKGEAFGLALVVGLTTLCSLWHLLLAGLSETTLHFIHRGALLPVHAAIVWSLAGTLYVRLPQFIAPVSWGGEAVPVSFGLLVAVPLFTMHALPGFFGTLQILGLLVLCHAAEWVSWSLLSISGVAKKGEQEEATRVSEKHEDKSRFLGRFADDDTAATRTMALVWYYILYVVIIMFSIWKSLNVVQGRIPTSVCIPSYIFTANNPLVLAMWWIVVCITTVSLAMGFTAQFCWPAVQRKAIPTGSTLVAASPDDDTVMIFRYCTRGTNPTLVKENVEAAHLALIASGLGELHWRIEVVTDNPLLLSERCVGVPVTETIVPSTYISPNGTKFKARALHYAVLFSELRPRPTDWIVHLDEETRFDAHTVCAVFQHCRTENELVASGRSSIQNMGQGVILYNTNGVCTENLMTALADTGRVSDDFSKFRFQAEVFKWSAMGMHGSFAVVCHGVEAQIGFDLGEIGSITEDSYFALKARMNTETGIRWIDAFMYEQSPFTIMDLIHQRARWFHGLFYCGFTEFPFKISWMMTLFVCMWSCGWLSILSRIVYAMFCRPDPFHNQVLGVIGGLYMQMAYFIGPVVNFNPSYEGFGRWLLIFILIQSFLTPIIGLMECSGILRGMYLVAKGSREFYVIQKEVKDLGPLTPAKLPSHVV